MRSIFWEDLEQDLKDPEFHKGFTVSSEQIKEYDNFINMWDSRTNDDTEPDFYDCD